MIKAATRATSCMGENIERLHRMTHRVKNLKVNIQASRYSWGCITKIENNVPFDIFREKIGNYISRTTKYGNKVVGIVETYKLG